MKKTLKKNQSVIITVLILIALVLAYFNRDSIKSFFSKKTGSKTASIVAQAPTVSTSTNTGSNDTILKKGSSGANVKLLQEMLNKKHSSNKPQFLPLLVTDGNFGSITETMLKKWTGKTSISINQLLKALV